MKHNFLSGIRFTDLTWAGAGSFATKVFADFGADILKIESSTRPDPVRLGGPFKDRIAGINRSGYFASRNTGKRSVALDLKTTEGKALLFELIAQSDVVSNNFAPKVMERLGLSYDEVAAVKPDIIYLSMPMYGTDGPAAQLSGVGMTISSVTGLMHHTAYGPGDVVGPGTHYPDHAANPYHAAFAVMAALRHRRRTGRGMKIDLSQVESTLSFVGPAIVETAATGKEPAQTGNRSSVDAPHNIFRCAGADEWCAIAVDGDSSWQTFATAIGRDDLASDPGLATAKGRLTELARLELAVTEWTSQHTAEEVVTLLQRAGIAAAYVASSKHLVERDEQLAARGYWKRIPHKELGDSLYANMPYLVDGERVTLKAPPLFGQHTKEVLSELLGRTQQQIATLEEKGALQ